MRNIFQRNVGAKITLGYLLILGLMLGISALAILRVDQINTSINHVTQELGTEKGLADDIVNRVSATDVWIDKYVYSQNQTDLDQFNTEFALLQERLTRADRQITHPKRVALLNQITPAVQEYGNAFAEVARLIQARQKIQSETLAAEDFAIETKLSALRIHVNSLNQPDVFLSFGNAQTTVQQMRVNFLNYFQAGDERYAILIERNYAQAKQDFETLERVLQDPLQRRNAIDAMNSVSIQYQGFQSARSGYASQRELFETKLDVLEPQIKATAADMAASVDQDYESGKQTAQSFAAEAQFSLFIVTIIALLTSLLLGHAISRDITATLRQVMQTSRQVADVDLQSLTTQLNTLSLGDVRLNLDITAQPLQIQSEDEVGQMAQAFNRIILRLHEAERAFGNMTSYLNEMAGAATNVAQGALNVSVSARSQDDVLGHALIRMILNLRAAEEQTHLQLQRLATLRGIDSLITTSLDLRATLKFLLEELAQQLHVDAAEILLLDPAGTVLEHFAKVGFAKDVMRASVLVAKSRVGTIVTEGRPIKIDNLEQCEYRDAWNQSAGENFVAYAGFPLIAQGQVKGVLQLFQRTPFDFDTEQTQFLEMLASQAAIAISHVELVKNLEERVAVRTAELQQRARQMQTATEISHAASGMLDLDTLLQQSVNLIHDRFGWWYVGLFLVDDQREFARLRAATGGIGQQLLAEGHPVRIDDTSMIGWCIQHAQARVAMDMKKETSWRSHPLLPDTGSEMALPLVTRGEVIGALTVQCDRVDAFGDSDVTVLQMVSSQLANAIGNARLYQTAQEQRDLADTLRHVGATFASTLDLDTVLHRILEQVSRVVPNDAAMIMLIEGDHTRTVGLRGYNKHGTQDFAAASSFRIAETPTFRLMTETGAPLVIPDTWADPRWSRLPDTEWTRSYAGAPIQVGGETIGILNVDSSIAGFYNQSHGIRLKALADQAAIAVENARLYAAAQQELAERKRAEEQLQQYSIELAHSNEELKRFVYIISHDLRAPLVNLEGFATELRSTLEAIEPVAEIAMPHLDEKHRALLTSALEEDIPEALGFIESSVTRMDHFINALLRLSRLGRSELNLVPVNMDTLVRETLETLAHRIEQQHVHVIVNGLPDIIADYTAMEQIMSNILNNAVLYLEPNRPGEIEISGERRDGDTLFRVRDNGRGIAPEDMDKVFAPFRRAGKPDVPGEGMGLAYVQTLVRRHGGRIWCESELGVGTTFTFTVSNQLAKGDNHAT